MYIGNIRRIVLKLFNTVNHSNWHWSCLELSSRHTFYITLGIFSAIVLIPLRNNFACESIRTFSTVFENIVKCIFEDRYNWTTLTSKCEEKCAGYRAGSWRVAEVESCCSWVDFQKKNPKKQRSSCAKPESQMQQLLLTRSKDRAKYSYLGLSSVSAYYRL